MHHITKIRIKKEHGSYRLVATFCRRVKATRIDADIPWNPYRVLICAPHMEPRLLGHYPTRPVVTSEDVEGNRVYWLSYRGEVRSMVWGTPDVWENSTSGVGCITTVKSFPRFKWWLTPPIPQR